MSSRRVIFVDINASQCRGQKYIYVIKRDLDQIKEIPSQNEKDRRRRYMAPALITLAAIACLIITGVIIALIIIFTRKSTSNTAANDITTTTTTTDSSTTTTTTSTTTSTSSSTTTTSSTSTSATTSVYGFSAGGAVVSGSSAYYGYEEVTVSCSVDLINMTIIITVQKTVGATYSGAFPTFWGGTVNQAYVDNGTQIIYTWTIVSGQTIRASGSPYRAQAQFSLSGTSQLTSADTYEVSATTVDGVTSTTTGHF